MEIMKATEVSNRRLVDKKRWLLISLAVSRRVAGWKGVAGYAAKLNRPG